MSTLIENANRIYTDKEAIKQAIVAKDVAVPDGTSLDEYAELIAQINSGVDTGDATAIAADILNGKTAYADNQKITGTMNNLSGKSKHWCNYNSPLLIPHPQDPTNQAIVKFPMSNEISSQTSLGDGKSNIGYYDKSSTVTGNIFCRPQDIMAGRWVGRYGEWANTENSIYGTATNDANATSAQILNGSTAYVKGKKITGSMANQGTVNHSLSINGSYTIPAGYHSGSGKVTQSITSKAAATYTPSTANQTIAAGQYLSGAQTIKGDTNLTPSNIISGKSIFGVKGTAGGFSSITITSPLSTFNPTSGTTFKSSSWQSLGNATTPLSFQIPENLIPSVYCKKYYWDTTVSNLIGGSITETVSTNVPLSMYIHIALVHIGNDGYGFRFSRGYASGTTTAQYYYTNTISANLYLFLNESTDTQFCYATGFADFINTNHEGAYATNLQFNENIGILSNSLNNIKESGTGITPVRDTIIHNVCKDGAYSNSITSAINNSTVSNKTVKRTEIVNSSIGPLSIVRICKNAKGTTVNDPLQIYGTLNDIEVKIDLFYK